jgi:hypothetical protein
VPTGGVDWKPNGTDGFPLWTEVDDETLSQLRTTIITAHERFVIQCNSHLPTVLVTFNELVPCPKEYVEHCPVNRNTPEAIMRCRIMLEFLITWWSNVAYIITELIGENCEGLLHSISGGMCGSLLGRSLMAKQIPGMVDDAMDHYKRTGLNTIAIEDLKIPTRGTFKSART